MARYSTPGVYFEWTRPERTVRFETGRPVFVGFVEPDNEPYATEHPGQPQYLSHWNVQQLVRQIGRTIPGGYLIPAVRGFFENGGTGCWVMPLPLGSDPDLLIQRCFERGGVLDDVDDADLVCAPDLMIEGLHTRAVSLQRQILDYCQRKGDRFAILDVLPARTGADHPMEPSVEEAMRQRRTLNSDFGALYHPWVQVLPRSDKQAWNQARGHASTPGPATLTAVPPCGHVAGVYARTDREFGPHQAPANAVIEGVLGLSSTVADREQGTLNQAGINCLRDCDGRGIRVWGARTLSVRPGGRYISVRRVILTLTRWIEHNLPDLVFELNEPSLWERIRARLAGYCQTLYQQGALRGRDKDEAFFIKCDSETNPREQRDAGCVVAYLGLAALAPAEFVILRITQSVSDGIRIAESPFAST